MNPGAVTYQREPGWCDGCRAVVTHLRAVREADGWHADWTCAAFASSGAHVPGGAAWAALVRECDDGEGEGA